jgi:PncC family amidohydrolase
MAGVSKTAVRVVERLRKRRLFITTVESCTGGGVADAITNVPGASEVFTGARVVYSSAEKTALGIPVELATGEAVYSEKTAIALARAGIEKATRADIGVGITGHISFPDPEHRNGVYIAVVFGVETRSARVEFPTRRKRWKVKRAVVEKTLRMILGLLGDGALGEEGHYGGIGSEHDEGDGG